MTAAAEPHHRPRTRVIPRERRNSPLALLFFGLVYAGILVLVLAPSGTFAPPPEVAEIRR